MSTKKHIFFVVMLGMSVVAYADSDGTNGVAEKETAPDHSYVKSVSEPEHDEEFCNNPEPVIGDITDEVAKYAAGIAVQCLNKNIPAVLSISSPGGNARAGLAAFDYFKTSNHPELLTTRAIGPVESAAIDVFLAGNKRIIGCNSYLMIHNSFVEINKGATFKRDDAVALAKDYEFRDGQISVALIARVTKLQPDAVKRMLAETTYISAQDALKLGFATEIAGDCISKK